MSISALPRFDELVSRYLDTSLVAAEESELLQLLTDQNLAVRFRELTQLDTEIAGILAGCIDDNVMIDLVWSDLSNESAPAPSPSNPGPNIPVPVPLISVRKPGKSVRLYLGLAAVAVLAFALVPLLFNWRSTPAPAAQVATVRGEVYLESPSGRIPITTGQAFQSGGTLETIGPKSTATLALAGGTTITLAGDTALRVGAGARNSPLFLEKGQLRSTVAKQPPNAPLIFGTSDATATVRGTELAIIAEKAGTYLIVTQGSVALQSSSGGPEVLIKAGFYGHVEQAGDFVPWPISRLPKALRDQALFTR